MNNRVIVIENRQKNFQLQLQQNRVINYNFVNYNYNFSKLAYNKHQALAVKFASISLCSMAMRLWSSKMKTLHLQDMVPEMLNS